MKAESQLPHLENKGQQRKTDVETPWNLYIVLKCRILYVGTVFTTGGASLFQRALGSSPKARFHNVAGGECTFVNTE